MTMHKRKPNRPTITESVKMATVLYPSCIPSRWMVFITILKESIPNKVIL